MSDHEHVNNLFEDLTKVFNDFLKHKEFNVQELTYVMIALSEFSAMSGAYLITRTSNMDNQGVLMEEFKHEISTRLAARCRTFNKMG